jgi:L,D-peptidoglycan transpeptidase YkuD (ErfK/YbiS/YcfS/YnhG family)
VQWKDNTFPCTVGINGFTSLKTEGDKKTPRGCFSLVCFYYRKDRIQRPQTLLPGFEILPNDGWSDDPLDPSYNQKITIPHSYSHENLFRNDNLYDLLVVTSHNQNPVVKGKGSAIFIHQYRCDKTGNPMPTAGCLGLPLDKLLLILQDATTDTVWDVL